MCDVSDSQVLKSRDVRGVLNINFGWLELLVLVGVSVCCYVRDCFTESVCV